jgi:hypothetical protein
MSSENRPYTSHPLVTRSEHPPKPTLKSRHTKTTTPIKSNYQLCLSVGRGFRAGPGGFLGVPEGK